MGFPVVVIGASAGGVPALERLFHAMPSESDCAFIVVVHVAKNAPSLLPEVIARTTSLDVERVDEVKFLQPSHVYVVTPDHHAVVADTTVRPERGLEINSYRPSIDVTLESAARSRGADVVGVILSGMLDDGARGLAAVQAVGGRVVIEDPASAAFPGMPRAALERASADFVGDPEAIAGYLAEIGGSDGADSAAHAVGSESVFAGPPPQLTCPSCGGPLEESRIVDGHGRVHSEFDCLIGHNWSLRTLAARKPEHLEQALLVSVRLLEEQACLSRRLADRAAAHGRLHAAERFEQRTSDAEAAAEVLRRTIDVAASSVAQWVDLDEI